MKTAIVAREDQEGMRLDLFLLQCMGDVIPSRSQAEKYIRDGSVQNQHGQVIVKPSRRVKIGEKFFVSLPSSKRDDQELKPYNISIPIVFEDEHILVVNKPAGLVVHPAHGHEHDTLVNALVGKTTLFGPEVSRAGIVHRLDRDVSGLMVLSKTQEAYHSLVHQFKTGTVSRLYRGLVLGKCSVKKDVHKEKSVPAPLESEWQKIESFIGRHPKDRKKFYSFNKPSAVAHARRAITYYRVIQSQDDWHLLEFRLKTGRTHQIRVHLASQSLWCMGDSVYGPRKKLKQWKHHRQWNQKISHLNRIALYSAKLCFKHPVPCSLSESSASFTFSLPWPKDLQHLLQFFSSNEQSS